MWHQYSCLSNTFLHLHIFHFPLEISHYIYFPFTWFSFVFFSFFLLPTSLPYLFSFLSLPILLSIPSCLILCMLLGQKLQQIPAQNGRISSRYSCIQTNRTKSLSIFTKFSLIRHKARAVENLTRTQYNIMSEKKQKWVNIWFVTRVILRPC